MSAQLRRSLRRKTPTPIAAARKRVRTPDVVTTVTESINAETASASSRVLVPSSGAQYWLPQVIPATSTTTGSIHDFSGNTVPGNSLCNNLDTLTVPLMSNSLNQPNQVNSFHVHIASEISQATREKIQRSEYIDLSLLLSNNNVQRQDIKKLVIVNGELSIKSGNLRTKINNIERWTSAIIIFISIYCSAHENRVQELLKYMSDVRLGAQRSSSFGWKPYDEQCRLRKACNPMNSWDIVDVELWLLYLSSSTAPLSFGHSQSTHAGANTGMKNKCYAFNYNGKCSRLNCPYFHACMKCSSLLHSVTSCPVLANQSPTQNRQLQPYRQPYQQPHRFTRPNLMYSNYSVPRQYHQTSRRRPPVAALESRTLTS